MMAEHVPQKDGAVRATAPAQGERDPSIHQDSCGLKLLPPRTLLRIGESNSRNIRLSSVANSSYARSDTLAIMSVLHPTDDKCGIAESLTPVFGGDTPCASYLSQCSIS